MKRHAARMRKWLLMGMPILWLALCAGHTGGGGAALFAWMLIGTAGKKIRYPYPRKSRLHFPRLFFAFSGSFFLLSLMMKGLSFLPVSPSFALPGISALCVLMSARLINVSIGKRLSLILSLPLFLIACM